MVSNTIGMELDDLVALLTGLRDEHGGDPDYQQWRAEFPADWPM